jgi:hypothetical protein
MEIREKARQLRSEGYTYSEICSSLKVPLPKSTLSYWCRDVALPKGYASRVKSLNLASLQMSRLLASEANQKRRKNYLESLEAKYSSLSKFLADNISSQLISLAVLYLTEGAKKTTGSLMFGNSDPRIITLFLKQLRMCFKIDESKFRCTVQCRADQETELLERYWSEVTKIPRQQFYAARIDARTVGKRTKKENYMGVCRIDYFSANIYNELQAIINNITGR